MKLELLVNKKNLGFILLIGVGALLLNSCGTDTHSESYAICDTNFPDSFFSNPISMDPLRKSCHDGVDKAYKAMVTPYITQKTVPLNYDDEGNADDYEVVPNLVIPDLQAFRDNYYLAKKDCVTDTQIPSDREKMACMDGLDIGAAVLARGVNYDIGENLGTKISLDDAYYASKQYYNVYDDFDDKTWAYLLMHRVYFPEFYPNYRRDFIYDPNLGRRQNMAGAGPTGGYGVNSSVNYQIWFNYYYGYSGSNYVYYPYHPYYVARIQTTGTVLRRYGPSAPPRPYAEGSSWYSPNRPGMPGAVIKTNVATTEFANGSGWRSELLAKGAISKGGAISSERASVKASVSRSVTISRGGLGGGARGGAGE